MREGLAWYESGRIPIQASNWRDASTAGGTGLVFDGDRRLVHSTASGLFSIYHRRIGDAVYFSSSLHALVRASDSGLSIDWDGWAGIFTFGQPLGTKTTFSEVGRLGPFTTIEWHSGGSVRIAEHEWPWIPEGVDQDFDPGAVVSALRQSLMDVEKDHALVPLSGGWDSRLLLSLLAGEDRQRVSAWTVNTDLGYDAEEEFASRVADALDVSHTVIPRRLDGYWRDAHETARRVDFQSSSHVWLLPLARHLRNESGVVFDGLAGDILLKSLFVTRSMIDQRDSRGLASLLWATRSYETPLADMVSNEACAYLISSARSQLDDLVAGLPDHPARPTLAVYRMRTMRGIGCAPMCILGADRKIATPFTDQRVANLLLRIDPYQKVGGALYPRVLREVHPLVADLPSTNTVARPKPRLPRRESSSEALEGYASHLGSESTRQLLSTQLTTDVDQRSLSRYVEEAGRMHVLRSLALFAHWCDVYGGSIGGVEVVGDLINTGR